jgi:hypothetical protein
MFPELCRLREAIATMLIAFHDPETISGQKRTMEITDVKTVWVRALTGFQLTNRRVEVWGSAGPCPTSSVAVEAPCDRLAVVRESVLPKASLSADPMI